MGRPIIVCLSANPAMDRRLRASSFSLGAVNRALSVEALPGGKAAHVAMVTRVLGARAVWIGFLGGAVGDVCAIQLAKLGIEVVPVPTKAATRLNFEVMEDSGRVTEILEPGDAPRRHERERMQRILSQGLRRKWRGALVVISGSLPQGAPPSFYASLIAAARASGSKVFLDTSGEALAAGLRARPDLVKPNRTEAEAVLGRSLPDLQSASLATRALVELGAKSAVVTLGSKGLVWLEGEVGPVWVAAPPAIRPNSTVGCGDSTMGGFAFAAAQGIVGENAVRLAVACGAANCSAPRPGEISGKIVRSSIPRVDVRRLPK